MVSQELHTPRSDLPETLLVALEALLRERSSTDISLREVARRAGVSHGAPGFHFQNKTGLLIAFSVMGYRRIRELCDEEVMRRAVKRGPEELVALGCAYVRFAIEHPEQFSVMFQISLLDPDDPQHRAARLATQQRLGQAVARCVREGVLRAEDAETFGLLAWSQAHGLASLLSAGRLPFGGHEEALARIEQLLWAFTERQLRAG